MTRDDILATIRANEPRLRELSVREISLFGSFARETAVTPTSDIDILVDFEEKTFDNDMSVRELLESLFPRKIDLVMKGSLKPRLRDRILAEAIRAA
jgi:Predicted nucleotidyltransferases